MVLQKQMNKEAGMDVEDGGVDMPDGGDGITRYPSQGGNIIGSDELDAYDDNEPPKQGGDDSE